MANRSLWEDYKVSLPITVGYDYTDFSIKVDGTTVFSGRAAKRPDSSGTLTLAPTVRVNDFAADYCKQVFIPQSLLTSASGANRPGYAHQIQVYAGATKKSDDVFYPDWSYAREGGGVPSGIIHDPIDFRLDYRQLILRTCIGSVGSVLFDFTGATDLTVTTGGDNANVFVNLAARTGTPTAVTVQGMSYTIDRTGCNCRYVLYYVNAFGGWDSIMMTGQPSENYGYDRKRFSSDYDNANYGSRGITEYANEVTRGWTLRTGMLTEDQSSRMHHLLGSPLVYLHDLEGGLNEPAIYAVVLTESQATVKTRNGNGRKPIQYEIGVQLAEETRR